MIRWMIRREDCETFRFLGQSEGQICCKAFLVILRLSLKRRKWFRYSISPSIWGIEMKIGNHIRSSMKMDVPNFERDWLRIDVKPKQMWFLSWSGTLSVGEGLTFSQWETEIWRSYFQKTQSLIRTCTALNSCYFRAIAKGIDDVRFSRIER